MTVIDWSNCPLGFWPMEPKTQSDGRGEREWGSTTNPSPETFPLLLASQHEIAFWSGVPRLVGSSYATASNMAGKTFFSLKFHCPVWQTSLLLASLKAKREKQRAGHTQPAAEKQIISDEPQFSGYKKELKSQLSILRSVCPSPGSEEIETLKEKFCFL